jgi:cytoskeletal protein RodZ
MPWTGPFWLLIWAFVVVLFALMIWFPIYYWLADRRRRWRSEKRKGSNPGT